MRRRICRSSKALSTNSSLCKPHFGQISKKLSADVEQLQKWPSATNEPLTEDDLVWLIEDSDKRGFYDLGRVKETIEGSDGVIRSAKVRTNDGVYKRPVVKLTPVLPNKKDVFLMENSAGDVKANH